MSLATSAQRLDAQFLRAADVANLASMWADFRVLSELSWRGFVLRLSATRPTSGWGQNGHLGRILRPRGSRLLTRVVHDLQ